MRVYEGERVSATHPISLLTEQRCVWAKKLPCTIGIRWVPGFVPLRIHHHPIFILLWDTKDEGKSWPCLCEDKYMKIHTPPLKPFLNFLHDSDL